MPFSITWDETIPIDHTKFRQQPGFVRDSKVALRERLAVDHYFLTSEGADTKIGYHKKCTLVEQTADPAAVADAGILYTKDVATITDLFYRNSAGAIIQITSGSGLNVQSFATGMILIWSGTLASIPSGWALCDGLGGRPNFLDRFLKCVPNGTTNPGTTGGTNANHSHTFGDHSHTTPDHFHQIGTGDGGAPSQITNDGGGRERTLTQGGSVTGLAGQGSTSLVSHLPAYYEVAFIYKT